MKQNEMFVFPFEDFDPKEIDLMDERNATLISPNLFRIQSISSKYYIFRNHLESVVATGDTFKNFKNLSGITYNFLRSPEGLIKIIKVRVNHIGKIIQVGEY